MKRITKRLFPLFLAATIAVPPVGVLAEENSGVQQLSERIQTGQPGDTINGDKIMIINTSDAWAKTGSLPETPLPGTEQESPTEAAAAYGIRRSSGAEMAEQKKNLNTVDLYDVGNTADIMGWEDVTLIGEGEHSYIWLQKEFYEEFGEGKSFALGSAIAESFDGEPYYYLVNACVDTSQPDWEDPIPYRDETGRFHVVVGEKGDSEGAYLYSDTQTGFYVKINRLAEPEDYAASIESLLIHEGQHLLLDHFSNGSTEIGRLDEGLATTLAMYSKHLYPDADWLDVSPSMGDLRTGGWGIFQTSGDNNYLYNYCYMQVRYLINQMAAQAQEGKEFNSHGVDAPVFQFFRKLYALENKTLQELLTEVLAIDGIETVEDATVAFFLALAVQEEEGLYGLQGDEIYESVFPAYPVYYSRAGERVNISPRAAILIDPTAKDFVIPTDGDAGLQYFAIMDKAADTPGSGGGTEEPDDTPEQGTESNPYPIADAADLAKLASGGEYALSKAYFQLTQDIVLPEDFPSIYKFSGTLDGDGHSITGNVSNSLISTNTGTIKNVHFAYPQINEASGVVMPMIQYNQGEVTDCRLTAPETTLTDANFGAGSGITLVYTNEEQGVIQYCSVDAQVTYVSEKNTNSRFALLCGGNGGRIQDCSVAGSLTLQGTFSDVYLGALAGQNQGSLIDCASFAAVSNEEATLGEWSACGSLLGSNNGELDDLYYLTEAGILRAVGGGSSTNVVGVSNENKKTETSFPGLDFSMIWKMGDAHPVLNTPEQRYAGVTKVEARLLDGKGSIMLGEMPDLREHAELFCNDSASVPVTNAMMDMTPLYEMKEAGTVTLHGTYNGVDFSISLKVTEPQMTIQGIAFKGKTNYLEKEIYTTKGVELKVLFEGKWLPENVTYGFTADLEGKALTPEDDTVIITYGDQRVPLPITVAKKTVTDINVLRAGKSVYGIGDKPDLSDVYLEICYDTGEVFYTSYEAGKKEHDLRIAVEGARNFSDSPHLYGAEAEAWLEQELDVTYDAARVYVFSGDPPVGYSMPAHTEKMAALHVGWSAAFRLIYEDGSPYLEDVLRDETRMTEAEAKGIKINSGVIVTLNTPVTEKDGIVGKNAVKSVEITSINTEKQYVYYNVVFAFAPRYSAKIEHKLPDGVSMLMPASYLEIGALQSCESAEDAAAKAEEEYTTMKNKVRLGLEGDKLVKLIPGKPIFLGTENDKEGERYGTIYQYQIPFTKEEIGKDASFKLSFEEYSITGETLPEGVPALPAAMQNVTAAEAGATMRGLLEQRNQNTVIAANGTKYAIKSMSANVRNSSSGYELGCYWAWEKIADSPSASYIYDWGKDAPITILENTSRRLDYRAYASTTGKEEVEAHLERTAGIQPGYKVNDIHNGKYGYWVFDGYQTDKFTINGNIVTLPGKWTWTPYYYVSYDWGEKAPENQTLPKNDAYYYEEAAAMAQMDETYKEGTEIEAENGTWVFSGWEAQTEGRDVIFAGSWKFNSNAPEVKYTVQYDWGSNVPESETLPADTTVYDSEADAKAAKDTVYTSETEIKAENGTWTFSGWTATTEGTVVTFSGSWTFAPKAPEVVKYTVQYKWDGDAPESETLPTDTTEYDSVEAAIKAMDTSYNANEVVTVEDGTWTFSGWTATTEDTVVTFIGSWTFTEKEPEVKYTVQYDWGSNAPKGETLPTDSTEYDSVEAAIKAMDTSYNANEVVTVEDGTWVFSGWTATTEDTVITFIGSWTFTEKEPEVKYTVQYDWGSNAPESETLPTDSTEYDSVEAAIKAMDTSYNANEVVTVEDGTWTFSGWKATTEDTVVTFIGSWTFTEKEPEVKYTVQYDWGSNAPESETLPTDSTEYDSVEAAIKAMDTSYSANEVVTVEDGTWTFSGWKATTEDTVVTFSGNWTFAPKASEVIVYQIQFDANGGNCSQQTATTKEDGTLGSLPKPTYSGYRFNGWYTASSGGEKITETTVFDSDKTIYAQWTKESTGGSGGGSSSGGGGGSSSGGGGGSSSGGGGGSSSGGGGGSSSGGGGASATKVPEKEPETVETKTESVAEEVTLENVDRTKALVLTINKKEASVLGKKIVNDVAPIIRNERTMLPIRVVTETLNGKVAWNAEARKVTITKGEKLIEIMIGQSVAYVNGKAVYLDTPAFIENSRTYLPLRFVAENLDATVLWDAKEKAVIIVPKAEATEVADRAV